MTNQRESVPPEQPAAKKKKKSLGRSLIILLLVLCAVLGAAALTSMEDGQPLWEAGRRTVGGKLQHGAADLR